MDISRNSWHYRYINSTPVRCTKWDVGDLCTYIRCFFYASLWRLFLLPSMIALGWILFMGIFGLFVGYGDEWAQIGGLIWCAIIFGGTIGGLTILRAERGYLLFKPVPKTYSPPNPFIQAIKDKHSKICRLVNFTS